MMCRNGGKFERFKKNLYRIFSAKVPLSNVRALSIKKIKTFGVVGALREYC